MTPEIAYALLGALIAVSVVLALVVLATAFVAAAFVRFLGNFARLDARREGGQIVVSGSLDDWRSPAPPPGGEE